MRYILCPKTKAVEYQISLSNHITKNSQVVLNEKEVICSPALAEADTLEAKADLLEGAIYPSSTELLNIIYE